jgi:putative hydrolase of the HAD superfamily
MIKNVVFDFGQTLVHFDPAYIVGQKVSDPADAQLLRSVVFDGYYFSRLDAGSISTAEVLAHQKTRLPERLWAISEEIYYSWIYTMPEIEGMRELILDIKQRFHAPVFLLSNISQYFVDHADEIPMLKLMDRCVFSCVCKMVKPGVEIFAHLCRECNIRPEESVFIDDIPANIEGAVKAGLHGYLFDGNVQKLRAYLESVL